MFPVWLGFRGGKGVATALGVLIALAWPVALVAALIWLAVASLSRYSSLAALIARGRQRRRGRRFSSSGDGRADRGHRLLLILRHHANIRRLIAGTESRISFRKS